jgi:tRNA U34 5-methylaminomethyl-2-thiouridine-forming methyltransferase MnmC
MKVELVTTGDGSSSLFVPELNEHYHSTFGAIAEARHIFIETGLLTKLTHSKELHVFEVGFGTGLNCYLTFLEAARNNVKIHYTSIEPNILSEAVTRSLNYTSLLQPSDLHSFHRLHASPWNEVVEISPHFSLEKLNGLMETIPLPQDRYDLVYFDAFGPDVQPELWTEGIFAKIYEATAEMGVLVTYSAKGSVRRALKSAGFHVEKLPGPPGKREITRAIKNSEIAK